MRDRKVRQPPHICETTVSRRSLLEWLGKATVLTLGGDLIAGCLKPSAGYLEADASSAALSGSGARGGAAIDTSSYATLDGGTEGDAQADAGSYATADAGADDGSVGGPFGFSPGKALEPIFDRWPERTADPQDLVEILDQWQLIVDGLTESPHVFSFGDLVSLPRHDQVTDFHCVEGWSVYDVPWNGIHISTILDLVKPLPEATHLTLYSVGDVYLESIPLDIAVEPKTLLAYGIDGSTIPFPHGFPLRLVIPRLLGYKNSKYLYRIELSDRAIEGFWVKNGYPYEGTVPEGRLRTGKY